MGCATSRARFVLRKASSTNEPLTFIAYNRIIDNAIADNTHEIFIFGVIACDGFDGVIIYFDELLLGCLCSGDKSSLKNVFLEHICKD